jgi:hypothetical protein
VSLTSRCGGTGWCCGSGVVKSGPNANKTSYLCISPDYINQTVNLTIGDVVNMKCVPSAPKQPVCTPNCTTNQTCSYSVVADGALLGYAVPVCVP